GVAAQLLSIQPLWDHTSDTGTILGRFSSRYALVLGLHVLLLVTWVLAFLMRKRVADALAKLPTRSAYGLIAVSGLAVLAFWFTHAEGQAQQYVALNWLMIAGVLIVSRQEITISDVGAPEADGQKLVPTSPVPETDTKNRIPVGTARRASVVQ